MTEVTEAFDVDSAFETVHAKGHSIEAIDTSTLHYVDQASSVSIHKNPSLHKPRGSTWRL